MPDFTLVIGNRNYSSWSLRAWLFLRASGIAFTEVRIPLDEPGTRAAIARYSPAGRVPVLVDGDHHIWESLAICEHAAERCGVDGWPAEPAARAVARAVAHEMHAGFAALRTEMPMNLRARGRRVTPSAAASADIQRVLAIWTTARERFGSSGGGLFGRFGIADAMYAPVAMRFLTYGVDLPATAAAWVSWLQALPAMAEWQAAALQETEVIAADEAGA